jgi:hypothetical protein
MVNGLLRFPWISGPAAGTDGQVLISVTDFRLAHTRDLPRAYLAGARLRHAWPRLQGAVGQWMWAQPLTKRSGAVSIWCTEEDLQRFVRWPVHVAIMHRYRTAGNLTSTAWHAEHFLAGPVWAEAAQRLTAGDLS